MGAEVFDVDGRNYEGAKVADGEEVVGAPAVVLHPDENFCMGLHISSPNLRLCPPNQILHVLEEIGSPIGRAQFTMNQRIQTFCRRLLESAVFGDDLPIGPDSDVTMQLICSATISFDFLFLKAMLVHRLFWAPMASHRLGLIA